MPLVIPPELKKVTPYVRRAEELDKDKSNAESRLVAYYCRQYAVHTGIDLATSTAGKTCLGDLLSSLEEEKVAMNSFTRDEAKFLCRKFADKIFDKADLDDRTGAATKNTAKTFYAAASFLEILNQFYKNDEGSEELAEIKKRAVYGKWKATEILKAINEGREPTPGGYGEDLTKEEDEAGSGADEAPKVEHVEDEDSKMAEEDVPSSEPDGPVVRLPSEEQSEDDDEYKAEPNKKEKTEEEDEDTGTEVELGLPPSYDFAPPPLAPPVVPPTVAKPPITFTPPPPAPAMQRPPIKPTPPPPVEKPEKKSGGGIFGFGKKNKSKLSKAVLADAMELTKFALAALEEKDSDLAAERLKQALKVLGR